MASLPGPSGCSFFCKLLPSSLLVTPTSHCLLLLLSWPWLFLAVPEQAQGVRSEGRAGHSTCVPTLGRLFWFPYSTFLRSVGRLLSAVNKRKRPSPTASPPQPQHYSFGHSICWDLTHNDCVWPRKESTRWQPMLTGMLPKLSGQVGLCCFASCQR